MEPVNIQKYQNADCTLYRIPPIDISSISSALDDALVEAWQTGQNADVAVDTLLQDDSLKRGLVNRVAQNLRFQRGQALEAVDSQKAEQLDVYRFDRDDQLEAVEGILGLEAQRMREAFQAAHATAQGRQTAYSASESELDAVRNRIRTRLDQFGGTEGYTALQEIRQAMQQPGYPAIAERAQRPTKSEPASYTTEAATTPADEQAPEAAEVTIDEIVGRRSRFRRAFRRIRNMIWKYHRV